VGHVRFATTLAAESLAFRLFSLLAPVQDFDALRVAAQIELRSEAARARSAVAKLNKAHAAAVDTLEL